MPIFNATARTRYVQYNLSQKRMFHSDYGSFMQRRYASLRERLANWGCRIANTAVQPEYLSLSRAIATEREDDMATSLNGRYREAKPGHNSLLLFTQRTISRPDHRRDTPAYNAASLRKSSLSRLGMKCPLWIYMRGKNTLNGYAWMSRSISIFFFHEISD